MINFDENTIYTFKSIKISIYCGYSKFTNLLIMSIYKTKARLMSYEKKIVSHQMTYISIWLCYNKATLLGEGVSKAV